MALSGANAHPKPSDSTLRSTRPRFTLKAAGLALLVTVPATFALGTAPAQADHKKESEQVSRYDASDSVSRRQERQRRRIEKGIASGDLTRSEVRDLNRSQDKIANVKYRYERDGYLSSNEIHKLTRYLDRASQRIHRYRNNNRYRGRATHYSSNNYSTHGYHSPAPRYRPHHTGPRIYLNFGHHSSPPRWRHKPRHKHRNRHGPRHRPFGGHAPRHGHGWPDRRGKGHHRRH